MLIEDGGIDIFIATKVFQQCNFAEEIVVKTNCEDAIKFLDHYGNDVFALPDFIFLDLFLPMQSGYDFIEAFSKKSTFLKNKCKIVVLSVLYNEGDTMKLTNNINVFAVLQKPLTEKSLKEFIELNQSISLNKCGIYSV